MNASVSQNTSSDERAYLMGLTVHGMKLGLDNIRFLLEAAGNPQSTYPTLHVAGTNGKGSVLAMLHAMLGAAGYNVGRFTSPHLLDLTERFQMGGAPIVEDALVENIAFFRARAEAMDSPPTFFELCTAVALRAFAQAKVDLALVEVGMGGRLDSTNVLEPLATAVTNIDLEHTQYLGTTLEEIAYEKAGILKSGVPAVVGEEHDVPRSVILKRARELDCPATVLNRDFRYSASGNPKAPRFEYASKALKLDGVTLSLPGPHQAANAAVAVSLAERLLPHFPRLDTAAIVHGLEHATWPCRIERVIERPPVYIDVAHNAAGASQLAQVFDKTITVLAVSSDKNAASIIAALRPIAKKLILTAYGEERALPLPELCAAANGCPHTTAPTLADAIERGMAEAKEDLPLLITGSIFTAAEAQQILMDRYGAPPPRF